MVVASVTAGVGASVSVELVFVTVLIGDVFLETTRQLELGAADLALVHSPERETIRLWEHETPFMRSSKFTCALEPRASLPPTRFQRPSCN